MTARNASREPCALCRDTAAVYPLDCAAVAPSGARIEAGAPVCLACVFSLEDAPETPGALDRRSAAR
ncbi:MAG: hypothetical protein U0324_46215 [Polyangiales bacterium]